MARLNQRQRDFAFYYVKHGNGTRAAIEAGYSKRTAHTTAYRLIKNDEVKKELSRLHAEKHMGPEEVLAGLADIARLDMSDFITPQLHGGARLNLRKAHKLNKLGFIREIQTKESIAVKETASDGDDDDTGVIHTGTLETKVKLYDKQRALETIANHHGLLKQPEININVNLHLHLELINRTWSALEKAGLDPVKTFEQLELLANGDIVH